MNAFDLCLEIVIVGSRGSGKTLEMTHFVCEALSRAWIILKLRELKGSDFAPKAKVNVWSNYPVRAWWQPHFLKDAVLLQSNPLDIDRLVIWDEQFHDGIIFFDEIDQVADRQDWYSTVAKFLTAGVQVMRHRNISLVLSIQSLEWLNARLQWQADIIIKCRDMCFTPWGRTNHVEPGNVIQNTFIDKSGVMTGYSYGESNKVYPMQFFGKRYFNAYQTTHEFDIVDSKSKRRVILPEKVLDMTPYNENENKNCEAIKSAIEYFVYNNTGRVSSDDLWAQAISFGFEGELKHYKSFIMSLGARADRKNGQSVYLLGQVNVGV